MVPATQNRHVAKLPKSPIAVGSATDDPLRVIYRNLSQSLELLEAKALCPEQTLQFATQIILEEDLRSLLEECEEYLFSGLAPESIPFQSFSSRSFTVLEEVNSLLK